MSEPFIRHLAGSDAAPLARLITQLGYPTDAAQMARRMESIASEPRTHAFVAESDTRVVGMIAVTLHRGYEYDGFLGEVINVVVDEDARRGGIGKRLMQAGEQWLREQGVRRIKINTSYRRTDTHRFYERMGYTSTGLRFVKSLD